MEKKGFTALIYIYLSNLKFKLAFESTVLTLAVEYPENKCKPVVECCFKNICNTLLYLLFQVYRSPKRLTIDSVIHTQIHMPNHNQTKITKNRHNQSKTKPRLIQWK